MSPQRGILTDQLVNILQVIQLGRKTGYLTVERGEGQQHEEGEITFVRGQITQAYCGQLHGNVAINWLRTWRSCRFLFVSTDTSQTTGSLRPVNLSTQNSQSLKDTNPFLQTSLSSQSGTNWRTTGPINALIPQQITQPRGSAPRRIRQADESLQIIAQAHLSRLHRHLFLLIDGNRDVAELIRLMGRKSEEVQQFLYDLERIGVIQLK